MQIISAIVSAKYVDLSKHADCFEGLRITAAKPDALKIAYAKGTPIQEVRDRFAHGLMMLLLKDPSSGASWALAEPIQIKVTGTHSEEHAERLQEGDVIFGRNGWTWERVPKRSSRQPIELPLAA